MIALVHFLRLNLLRPMYAIGRDPLDTYLNSSSKGLLANTALTDFVKTSLINCLGCQAGGGNVRTEVKCMEGRINEFNQQNTIFSAPRQSKLPFIRLKFVLHKTQLIRANLLRFFLLGPDPPLYRRHHCSSLHHR